jgi:hypothetical protein
VAALGFDVDEGVDVDVDDAIKKPLKCGFFIAAIL